MAEQASGILQRLPKGSGFLRDPALSYQPSKGDAWVSPKYISEFNIVEGAEISGNVEKKERGLQVTKINKICGLSPEKFKSISGTLSPLNPRNTSKGMSKPLFVIL